MNKLVAILLVLAVLVPPSVVSATPPVPAKELVSTPGQKGLEELPPLDLTDLPVPEGQASRALPAHAVKRDLGAEWVKSLTPEQRQSFSQLLAGNRPASLTALADRLAQAKEAGELTEQDRAELDAASAELATWQETISAGLADILTSEQYRLYRDSLLPAPDQAILSAPQSENDCYYAFYYLYNGNDYAYYFYVYAYYTYATSDDPYAPQVYYMAYDTYYYSYYAWLYSYYAYVYYYNSTYSYYAYYLTRHSLGLAYNAYNLAYVLYTWTTNNSYSYYSYLYGYYAWYYIDAADGYASGCAATGFDSQFNGSAPGWGVHSGTWYVDSNYLYTYGLSGTSSSVSYETSYTNFDYQVRLSRSGCSTCANRLIVRGTPTPLQSDNWWNKQYVFQISVDGEYSVYKQVSGSTTALKSWTYSSAINQGSAWNTLRVVANGSSFYFYINGTLVWSGSDSSLSSGRVGIGMYRSSSSSGDLLKVDWAKLSVSNSAVQELPAASAPEPVAPAADGNKDMARGLPAEEGASPEQQDDAAGGKWGIEGHGTGRSPAAPAGSLANRGLIPFAAGQRAGGQAVAPEATGANDGRTLPAGFELDLDNLPVPEALRETGFAMSLDSQAAWAGSQWARSLTAEQRQALRALAQVQQTPAVERAFAALAQGQEAAPGPTPDRGALDAARAELKRWQSAMDEGLASILTAEQYAAYRASLLPAPDEWRPGAPQGESDCYYAFYYEYYYGNDYAYYYYVYAYYAYAYDSDPYLFSNYAYGYYTYVTSYYGAIYSYYAYLYYYSSTYSYYAYYFTRHAQGLSYWGYQLAYLAYDWVVDGYTYYAYLYAYNAHLYIDYADDYAVACNGTGFDSQFNGSASGWEAIYGTWYVDSAYLYTYGTSGYWHSVSYTEDFSNFDYQAKMSRTGDTTSNNLIIRGTPSLLSTKAWTSGYMFQYTNDGYFSVWKYISGGSTALKYWTYSSLINQGSGWNTLRVVANGSSFSYYINGALVWSGSDSSFSSGRVGIMMYRSSTSSNLLDVDWAKLSAN